MTNAWRTKGAASAAATLLLVAVSGEASARGSCLIAQNAAASSSEVSSALASFGGRVVAVGRVDAVSRQLGVDVLGVRVMPSAYDNFQVGDYASVIDWSKKGSTDRVLEVRPLSGRYVPGASEVFLRSRISGSDALRAHVRIGAIRVDYSNATVSVDKDARGVSTLAIRGIQPQPRGVVLSSCIALLRDGSLGTGRAEGPLVLAEQMAPWEQVVPTVHWALVARVVHWALVAPKDPLVPAEQMAPWDRPCRGFTGHWSHEWFTWHRQGERLAWNRPCRRFTGHWSHEWFTWHRQGGRLAWNRPCRGFTGHWSHEWFAWHRQGERLAWNRPCRGFTGHWSHEWFTGHWQGRRLPWYWPSRWLAWEQAVPRVHWALVARVVHLAPAR